jgi:hypothetical protein
MSSPLTTGPVLVPAVTRATGRAVARLKADIDELNRMLAEKTQAYEEARRLLRESQEQFNQARADGIASHGEH